MNTQEVAEKVVELCRKQAWKEAVGTLYAKDIVSVEAFSPEGGPTEMRGIEAIHGKVEWWTNTMEVHDCKVGEPFVAHDRFVVQYDMDVTDKEIEEADADVGGGRLHGEGWQDRAGRVSA